MTRQAKTPRQRAEESLGVAQRRVARIARRLAAERAVVVATESELAKAELRLEYAEQDPALAQPQITTTEENR